MAHCRRGAGGSTGHDESRWVMPAFEVWFALTQMTTTRNWVSKVRSRADLLPHGDVGAPERVQSEVAFAGCQAARYDLISALLRCQPEHIHGLGG